MWNEEKGFGFISPSDGGEDVFVHRTGLNEGVALVPGNSVTYEGIWDERKRKYRASNVADAPGGSGSGGADARRASTAAPQPRARSHNIVGAFADWAIHKDPMTPEGSEDGPVRHRLIVRAGAPQAPGDNRAKREEFQIVGDGDWDKRLYPAGPDKEEVVVLRPGDTGSRAANDRGKGHGRNWAVEGRPGTAFDIVFDPDERLVTCETAFSES